QSIFATENDLTSLKNDMKKTKLENQQQVWKGCKKQPVRQQAWHIPKIWSAAYRHTGRNLCNSF
ncbi:MULTISPECIES: hypothetical protein, partial [Bacteroidales]